MRKYRIALLYVLVISTLSVGCTTGVTDNQLISQEIPLYADNIQEGTYAVNVSSSSGMFRITDAQLTVRDGKMSAVITLSGTAYLKLYMGTSDEALMDTDDNCIHYNQNRKGKYTYEVPVKALNINISCAAWSKRSEKWYDRVLVFRSNLIPKDAIISY